MDSSALSEPLLGPRDTYEDSRTSDTSDDDDYHWSENRRKEQEAWAKHLSRLLAQWAQWFSSVVLAGGLRVGNNIFRTMLHREHNGTVIPDIYFSPLQEDRLEKLQQRLAIPFDGAVLQHQDALKALWRAAFPERVMPGLVSPQWKEMGWQGNDPSTDFRGGGFISLENLLFFAQKFPVAFQRLLHKQKGKRAEWEYPFAVAGLNITFLLIQMLDLRAARPSSTSGAALCNMLAGDEMAFDMLYCVAFATMDAQWLSMGASYMDFHAVLQATRVQLENEMMMENVHRVEDLPSYRFVETH